MVDSVQWVYPRGDSTIDQPYTIGDSTPGACLNWCMASAYLLSAPLREYCIDCSIFQTCAYGFSAADELPRIIHDLGPRYVSRFQAGDIIRFLTYEAATALNINLFARAEQTRGSAAEVKNLINSFKNGLGIGEASIIFAISPATTLFENKETGDLNDAVMDSDIFVARCNGLDLAMWEIGGAAVALRLVQLASVSYVLHDTVKMLIVCLERS